jgi:AraC family transcriptional regulator
VYEAGNAGIVPVNEAIRMRWRTFAPTEHFENAHLYLSSQVVNEVAEEFRRVGSRHADHPLSSISFRDPMLGSIAGSLLGAMHRSVPSLYAEQAGRYLITHLLAHHRRWWDADSDHRAAPIISDRQIARVLEYMSAHLADDLTLRELAAEACISVNHFVRRFRERTGATPFAYLTGLRIEAAKRMLATTEIAISKIALSCGYANPGAFSSAFQRHVGSSPRAFRALG